MTCIRGTIQGRQFFLSLGGDICEFVDQQGRMWRFEDHPMFGPLVVGKSDQILAIQPGSRSTFWALYARWKEIKGAATR